MKKRFIAILMVFALALTGCGSNSQKSDSPSDSGTDKSGSTNEPFTIRTTMGANELSEEQIAEFESQNPGIKVEIVTADDTKLMAMLAAGNPVDVIRTSGMSTVAAYVTRGLCLPLDSYMEKSTVIKKEDFAAVQGIYQFDGQEIGKGPVYGFAKDWSIDNALWINKKLFRDAGVEIPAADKVYSSTELAELSKKLTKKEDGKVSVFGLVLNVGTDPVAINLASIGKSLWSEDMKTSNFSSPEAKSILKYFTDLQMEGYLPSSLNPLSDGWGGTDFMNDKIAIYQQGYWYGGMLRSNEELKDRLDDFVILPAPAWEGGTSIPAVTGGTGAVVYSGTKNPDAVWKFMEYFFAGKPADDRTASGWGLPSFKSKMSLLPNTTDFDKAINEVTNKQMEIANLSVIKVNKFAPANITDPIFTKYLDPVIYGKATLDDATKSMDEEIASVIADAMDVAGVE